MFEAGGMVEAWSLRLLIGDEAYSVPCTVTLCRPLDGHKAWLWVIVL